MKIAICTPTRDTVHSGYAFDLVNMALNWKTEHEVQFFMASGTLLPEQRQKITEEALTWGADYLLWIDSDMRFPFDALALMISRNKPIVAASYPSRTLPCKPVCYGSRDKNDVVYTEDTSTGTQLVNAVGMGFMLVKREVYDAMDRPYYISGYISGYDMVMGEDTYFCNRAAERGFPVEIDHDVSRHVRHIGVFEFTHNHALAFREQINGVSEKREV